jgi:hypothetical protein
MALLRGEADPVGRTAAVANCNRKTAGNIWRGDNAPNGVHLLNLMANLPGFAAEMGRLTGSAEWWLPEFERERQAALAKVAREMTLAEGVSLIRSAALVEAERRIPAGYAPHGGAEE